MTLETAKKCVDWIFINVPADMNGVELAFIGGEPLLEFELLKEISYYIFKKNISIPYILFATTNGTLLNKEMKQWFNEHKEHFRLGLSLDGNKKTHDFNRSNSFDLIDIDYFVKTWPTQGVKMTLSEYSLVNLAENIKFIHSLGFTRVDGANLHEGDFDWNKDKYIELLIPQLAELVDFYLANEQYVPMPMLDKHIDICEAKNKETRNWCGIGRGVNFFDCDGTMYPCAFVTPMTFQKNEINDMMKTDFINDKNFIDIDCYENCYIYPICPTCAGANYIVNKNFKKRNRSKCRIQKLIALFAADFQGKRLLRETSKMDNTTKYHTIEAIKKIRLLYLNDFTAM